MLNDTDFLRIIEATPLVSVDLIVRNEKGEALLGHRRNRPAQGFWFVPGGRIRKNERVADALERIARHELGVRLAGPRLVGVFDHVYEDNFLGTSGVNTHYVVLGFEAELAAGIPFTPDDQHSAWQWWPVGILLENSGVHENTKAYFRVPAPDGLGIKTPPGR